MADFKLNVHDQKVEDELHKKNSMDFIAFHFLVQSYQSEYYPKEMITNEDLGKINFNSKTLKMYLDKNINEYLVYNDQDDSYPVEEGKGSLMWLQLNFQYVFEWLIKENYIILT